MIADLVPELRRLIREEVQALRCRGAWRRPIAASARERRRHRQLRRDGASPRYGDRARQRTGRHRPSGRGVDSAGGALVLVQFVGGDINAPVVTGTFYTDEDRPPANADGQVIWNLPADASPDEALRLEVSSDRQQSVVLKVASAVTVEITDDDPAVNIDVGGNAQITIDSDGRSRSRRRSRSN